MFGSKARKIKTLEANIEYLFSRVNAAEENVGRLVIENNMLKSKGAVASFDEALTESHIQNGQKAYVFSDDYIPRKRIILSMTKDGEELFSSWCLDDYDCPNKITVHGWLDKAKLFEKLKAAEYFPVKEFV